MGRAFTYMIFFTMTMVIFELSGIGLIGSGLASELGLTSAALEDGWNIQSSQFWTNLFTVVLAVAVASAIAIGFITKSSSENFIVLPFITGSALLFIDVLVGILSGIGVYPLYIGAFLLVILGGLGVGFVITMMEWFRGNV